MEDGCGHAHVPAHWIPTVTWPCGPHSTNRSLGFLQDLPVHHPSTGAFSPRPSSPQWLKWGRGRAQGEPPLQHGDLTSEMVPSAEPGTAPLAPPPAEPGPAAQHLLGVWPPHLPLLSPGEARFQPHSKRGSRTSRTRWVRNGCRRGCPGNDMLLGTNFWRRHALHTQGALSKGWRDAFTHIR